MIRRAIGRTLLWFIDAAPADARREAAEPGRGHARSGHTFARGLTFALPVCGVFWIVVGLLVLA